MLHVSDTHPPSPELLRYAQAIDAALAEAGRPDAFVSVNTWTPLVSTHHHSFETGRIYDLDKALVAKAFEVARPLDPRKHTDA